MKLQALIVFHIKLSNRHFEDSGLLECDAVLLGEWFLTFQS